MYNKEHFTPLSGGDKFGIDKIKLFTTDFEVRSTKEWAVKPHTKQAGEEFTQESILTTLSSGEQIAAEKMYNNSGIGYTTTIQHGSLWVEFNPSKMLHDYHLTADSGQIADIIQHISDDLINRDLAAADLFSANISRLDITAQDIMQHNCAHYHPVIRSAKNLKRAPRMEYPSGYLIGNAQRQICIYDKGLKLQMDSGTKHPRPSNLYRIEHRFNNARQLKQNTPFKSIADILSADSTNAMKYAYSRNMSKTLPISQYEVQFIEQGAIIDLLRRVIKTHARQWQFMAVSTLAMAGNNNLPTAMEWENALQTLAAEGLIPDRTDKIRDKVSRLMEVQHTTQFMAAAMQRTAEENYAEIHTEFKEKFILPYAI